MQLKSRTVVVVTAFVGIQVKLSCNGLLKFVFSYRNVRLSKILFSNFDI